MEQEVREAALFEGIPQKALEKLLTELKARVVDYPAGSLMLLQGEDNGEIAVVLRGRAVGERTGSEGRVAAVNEFFSGSSFGDVLSGATVKSPVTVRAAIDCRVLRFSFERLFDPSKDPKTRALLLRNLIREISDKYFALNRRILVLTGATLRGKAARYLRDLTGNFTKTTVRDKRNREEQARYLGCDRSALSRELSALRGAGLLRYRGNEFHIIDAAALADLAER